LQHRDFEIFKISSGPLQFKNFLGFWEKSRRARSIGNRVAPEIKQKVLDYSLEFPTQGQVRASNELKLRGFHVSAWYKEHLAPSQA